MNNDDYEQNYVQKDFISNVEFLKEGNNIDVLFHADEEMPFQLLPLHVILKISHTEPGVKGNTATNATKPATTETELKPTVLNKEGIKIKIDTEKIL